ncbi:MAG: hypothetical protein KJZ87_12425 [Thermoguttaceae bacterium]|nr:hypothetical protein [Thermoguttaceae bacterium]
MEASKSFRTERVAAVSVIREHDPARPLFLYVPFNAVHSPFQGQPTGRQSCFGHTPLIRGRAIHCSTNTIC